MISWIQRTFQHHFRTVFAIVLVFTIISLIVGINAAGGIGHGDRQHEDQDFFGYNLSVAQDQQRVYGDAQLSVSLQVGPYANIGAEQIQAYALQRVATLYVANQWHIPAATDAEIVEHIKTLRSFAGQNGEFDAKAYTEFKDRLKTNPRGTNSSEGDIKRVMSDDIRADKVQKLLAGPGYVLPGEVKTQLGRSDTTWTLATATVDYTTYKPDLKPSDADISKYFEEEAARFQVAPRIVVAYVAFNGADYAAKVSVTEAEVRAFYDANPARFPKPPTVKPADDKTPTPPANPEADFAAVRTMVEASLKMERAQKLALQAAAELTVSLYTNKVQAAGVDAFLAKNNLTAKTLAPFTKEAGPAELPGATDFAAEAFGLPRPDRAYSDPVRIPGGAAVIFHKETQPARKPALAEVRDKVVAAWSDSERNRRFVELGKTIKSQLEASLKAGDTMEKAAATAASANSVKIEAKTLPAFMPRTRPQDVDYTVLGALTRLEKGQLSDMAFEGTKGTYVYALDKKAPDASEANPQYAETRKNLSNMFAMNMGSASDYLSELMEKEQKKFAPAKAQ